MSPSVLRTISHSLHVPPLPALPDQSPSTPISSPLSPSSPVQPISANHFASSTQSPHLFTQ
jgi:hypothetical protein